jgi:nucleoside-diphosphate-sugar epimerase
MSQLPGTPSEPARSVLITGGSGFIGSRLALKCLEQGEQVRAFGQLNTDAEYRNKAEIEGRGVEFAVGSVTDRKAVADAVAGIDVIYHLAAAQHEMNVPDQHFWDVNVEGTRNVLDAGLRSGVKRVVHGSTIGVFGSAMLGEIDEETPLHPDNIYGSTKRDGETLALSYGDRLPVTVIRISETYGPGDRRLLKLFRALGKGRFFMIGDGKNLHQPVYVDDLVAGLRLAAVSEAALGQVFVLAGKEVVTTEEMVAAIAAAIHARPPGLRAPLRPFLIVARILEAGLRPIGIQPPLHPRRMDFFRKSFRFSQEKAKRVLGFEAAVDFAEGAGRTAAWYREQALL